MNEWHRELVAAGLARVYRAHSEYRLIAPAVTVGGTYHDTEGWAHQVTWHAGRLHVDLTAYADRYRDAERAVEERHGPWGPWNDAEFTAALRAELGLVAV